MAFGVAFSVNSNLGVSPVNSLPYVISKIIHMDLAKWIVGDLRVVGWKDHETVEKSDRSGGTEVLFLEINGGQWNERNENVTGNYARND